MRNTRTVLADHPPRGIDPIAWTSQTETISGGLDEFEMDRGDEPSTTKPLTEMLEGDPGFFALMTGGTP